MTLTILYVSIFLAALFFGVETVIVVEDSLQNPAPVERSQETQAP